MSKKLYPEENIQAIANAIRALNGSSDTYAVGDMADAIEMPDNAYYLKETEADNPLVITDGEELNAQSCEVSFEPIQDLHGYDSPWPAGGGKNKLPTSEEKTSEANGVTLVSSNGVLKLSGTASANTYFSLSLADTVDLSPSTNKIAFMNDGVYSVSITFKRGTSDIHSWGMTTENRIASGWTDTGNENVDAIIIAVSQGVEFSGTFTISPMLLALSETDVTHFAPYSNISPIIGRDNLVLTQTGKNGLQGMETGLIDQDTGENIPDDANKRAINRIYVKSGETYTISGMTTNSKRLRLFYYNNKSGYLSNEATEYFSTATFTLTIPNGVDSFRFQGAFGSFTDNVMVESGQTATTYEPYQDSTHTATFPDTKYGGIIDMVSGKALIKWVKANMGSLAWTLSSSGLFQTYSLNSVIDKTGDGGHAKYTSKASIFKEIDANSIAGPGGSNPSPDGVYALSNTGTLYFNWLKYDNTTDFIAAISNEDFVYELATPTEIQLDPDVIKLLQDNNVFTTDGKTVKVRYLSKHI